MSMAQPAMKGSTRNNMVHFRPIMLMRKPIGMHTEAAPRVMAELIHENWVSLTGKSYPEPLSTIFVWAGDVHPKRVPQAKAPPAAARAATYWGNFRALFSVDVCTILPSRFS